MKRIKKYWRVLKDAFGAFNQDNCMKLSAALSYYTVFSIGPVLVIVISLSGWFYGQEAVQGKIYGQISGLVGADAALQVQQIIQNVQQTGGGVIGTIVGAVVLFLGATGIFTEIQDSINYIWSLRAKPKRGFVKLILNRLLSFSLVISLGFLLLVSLVASALLELLNELLTRMFPDTMVVVVYIVNVLIVFAVITVLFAVIFKVLPDGKIKWKDSFIGASFTAVLFIIGKTAIGLYLGKTGVASSFGAAGSLVVLLVWVYFSAQIFLLGAEFTWVYSHKYGSNADQQLQEPTVD